MGGGRIWSNIGWNSVFPHWTRSSGYCTAGALIAFLLQVRRWLWEKYATDAILSEAVAIWIRNSWLRNIKCNWNVNFQEHAKFLNPLICTIRYWRRQILAFLQSTILEMRQVPVCDGRLLMWFFLGKYPAFHNLASAVCTYASSAPGHQKHFRAAWQQVCELSSEWNQILN